MKKLRKIDYQVLAELMKNAKNSDRKLSQKIGVSQPTVTRIRLRLEKEGYIREYTAIPDFTKLGYELMAISFVKLKSTLTAEQVKEAQKRSFALAKKSQEAGPFEVIMAERGDGMRYNGVFISYHKNYSDFHRFRQWLRQFEFFEVAGSDQFLISLHDKIRYLPLTMSNLVRHMLIEVGKKNKKK